jgi:DNA-directed RNA polymerase subunit F
VQVLINIDDTVAATLSEGEWQLYLETVAIVEAEAIRQRKEELVRLVKLVQEEFLRERTNG